MGNCCASKQVEITSSRGNMMKRPPPTQPPPKTVSNVIIRERVLGKDVS